jgi:polyhydroxyalkanoate synthesis regulator phasin
MLTKANENLFEMVTILDQKKERLKMILTLTQQQRELFTLESIEMLESNLRLKQTCIDDINRLDEGFEKYYKEIADFKIELQEKCKKSDVTETLVKRLQEGTAAIQDMMRQIQKAEAENHQRAAELMQLVKENLEATSKQKKAVAVYGKNQLQSAVLDK